MSTGFRADWAQYRRLIRFTLRYWRVMVVLTVAVLVGAAMEPMLPALMKPLVDESLVASNTDNLWIVPVLLVLVVLLRGLADYVVTFCSQYLANRTVEDLRQALFAKELDLSLERHAQDDGGRMMTRITYDPQMVADAVSEAWMVLIRDSLVLVGLIGFLFYTAWELAVFVFAAMPFLIISIRRIGQRLRVSSGVVQDKYGRLTGLLQEALLGLREIKIFGARLDQERRFSAVNESLRKEQMRVVRTSALAGPLVGFLTAITVATVIYLASFMTATGGLTPGEFVAFITALAMVFGPMRRLTAVNISLQRGLAAADAIFGLLDTADERGDRSEPFHLIERHRVDPRVDGGPRAIGEIKFEGVSFTYPHQDAPAVDKLTFVISPGEVVALLGPSGSGKSTVLALLSRFYRPDEGMILLDGNPIGSWDLDALRRNLALVGQRVMLFDDSIKNNIRMGRLGASNEEVLSAAKSSHAWEFIEKLPDQLDTPLGSLGDRLSGGQRQRIAIARAFLKDAPILLLDEATSALDRESEEAVLDGLERLIQGRTVLMVSHSPERLRGVTRTIDLGVQMDR
ncbi:MAG: ATP-binding cassette domain-containing protein [Betaproteobacteria bacterium]|nr:ATP-binding cassette domain-containing protein [Betaproteobacteria bacterium]